MSAYTKEEENAVESIIEACHTLEWTIAINEPAKPDDDVPGVIIGTPEYVASVLSYLPDDFKSKTALLSK